MQYNRSTKRDKWTIMMYMRDFNLMATYAYAIRASNELTDNNIDDILAQMERDDIYHPRYGGSTFTGTFKSIQVAWYMFGYYEKNGRNAKTTKKMVFTPLGNLLLDNLKDREKAAKIFMTMLFANPFRQPFSQMDERFNIFGFRLILKLLRDPRLGGRLYNDEAFYLAMFVKSIEPDQYESLVTDILALRARDPYEKFYEFRTNEEILGLACHEWRYATGMLQSAGIVSVHNDHDDRIIGQFEYGNINPLTGHANARRAYREDYIELRGNLIPLLDKLLAAYPYYAKPYDEETIGEHFNSSMVVELYSFYPRELLTDIGVDTEDDMAISAMLSIASDVQYFSREETDGGVKFEYALADAFNLFADVEAQRIGGAGQPDVECIFYRPTERAKKFDIEAKATSRKLTAVNSPRLLLHRQRIGSNYTIIATPSFAIGVLRDISGQSSVIIKAATLANYLYQYITKYGRDISYAMLDQIIEANMGRDITGAVDAYVYTNFGHAANDLTIRGRAAAQTPQN